MAFLQETDFYGVSTLYHLGMNWDQMEEILRNTNRGNAKLLEYYPFSRFIFVDSYTDSEEFYVDINRFKSTLRENRLEYSCRNVERELRYAHPQAPFRNVPDYQWTCVEGELAEAYLFSTPAVRILIVRAEGTMFFLNKLITSVCFMKDPNVNFFPHEDLLNHNFLLEPLINNLNHQGRLIRRAIN